MSSFTSALHYGQSIFEGLKAYYTEDQKIGVYRVKAHAKRFRKSAKIMGMPEIAEELFEDCVLKFVDACREIVPKEEGHSLYLRPLMFSNDPVVKVSLGENYRFIVMGSIVGPYFNSGKEGARIYCNKEFIRAFPRGTGEAKTAANYALSLPALKHAQSLGFEQVLYLDAMTKKNLEELGGMNFFMLKGNTLATPKLMGTILEGITRDSILQIASSLGLETEEREIPLVEILENNNSISVFASGTAATIVPIAELGVEMGMSGEVDTYKFKPHDKVEELRLALKDCQLNRHDLSKSWITFI